MDETHVLAGDHSPKITLAGNEARGIRQTGVKLVEGTQYVGRVQLAGDRSAKVKINIVSGAGAETQTLDIGSPGKDYKKYNFTFVAKKTGEAQLEVVGTGKGEFYIGAVSLMPADNIEGGSRGRSSSAQPAFGSLPFSRRKFRLRPRVARWHRRSRSAAANQRSGMECG